MAKAASGKKPAAKKPVTSTKSKGAKAVAKKPGAAKKPAPTSKPPAKKPAAAKKAVTAKKPAAKKAPTTKKGTGAKKAAPAKKAVSTKAAPAKKAVTAKKPAPAKKVAAKVAAPKAPVEKVKVKAARPPEKKLPKGAVICPLSGIIVSPQKPNISPKTLEKLRELLLEELAKHTRQAEDLRAEADQLANDREQGDTQFDEESGEGDTVSVERERDLLLSASARQTVDEIRAALDRMDAGTYGLCSPAGRRITLPRLEAIPWADQCVDCKGGRERRR